MKNPELQSKIKELVSQQVALKNQRKTVNLVGPRTMEPWEASYKHTFNRVQLRNLYMAQGLLRGKTQEQIESNPKTPINMDAVNKLIEQYEKTAVRVN